MNPLYRHPALSACIGLLGLFPIQAAHGESFEADSGLPAPIAPPLSLTEGGLIGGATTTLAYNHHVLDTGSSALSPSWNHPELGEEADYFDLEDLPTPDYWEDLSKGTTTTLSVSETAEVWAPLEIEGLSIPGNSEEPAVENPTLTASSPKSVEFAASEPERLNGLGTENQEPHADTPSSREGTLALAGSEVESVEPSGAVSTRGEESAIAVRLESWAPYQLAFAEQAPATPPAASPAPEKAAEAPASPQANENSPAPMPPAAPDSGASAASTPTVTASAPAAAPNTNDSEAAETAKPETVATRTAEAPKENASSLAPDSKNKETQLDATLGKSIAQSPAQGEAKTSATPGAEEDSEAIFIEDKATSNVNKTNGDKISLDFPDTEVRRIIRNVADIYNLNVIIPESLVGNVSIKLSDVSWRQVLEVVLEPFGFQAVEDGNIIKIKSREDLQSEPIETRLIALDYANANDLKPIIQPFLNTEYGKIEREERTNHLIVTERKSKLNEIEGMVRRLDTPTPQVMIESKFIETSNSDALKMGMKYADAIKVSAEDSGANAPRVNLSRNATFKRPGNANPAAPYFNTDTNTQYNRQHSAIFTVSGLSATLNILKQDNRSKIVNNPTLVTMNNKPAKISILRKEPFPNYQYNQQTGSYEVSGYTSIPIGTELLVTPRVNSNDTLALDLEPSLSSSTNDRQLTAGANPLSVPIVNETKTKSTVTIKDGYTVAISGFGRNENTKKNYKVPILGNLPVVGPALFSNRDYTEEQTYTVIFVTAKILNPDGTTYMETLDPRILQAMRISGDQIPGYQLPEATLQKMKATREHEKKLYEDEYNEVLKQNQAQLDLQLKEYRKAHRNQRKLHARRKNRGEPLVRGL